MKARLIILGPVFETKDLSVETVLSWKKQFALSSFFAELNIKPRFRWFGWMDELKGPDFLSSLVGRVSKGDNEGFILCNKGKFHNSVH